MGHIPVYVSVSFDSSAFWPPQENEKLAVEKLLYLFEQHEVDFSIPEAVLEETGRAPQHIRKMAHAHIYNYDVFHTSTEQRELLEVQRMLFDTKVNLSKSDINDVRNLQSARKYSCTYFVTFDKRHILSKRDEIKSKLGVQVVTPSECLNKMQEYLAQDRKA